MQAMYFSCSYFFILFIETIVSAECPRKRTGIGDQNATPALAQAPGFVPSETRISCIYMHNDKSELDQVFSDDVLAVLDEITRRLKREVRVNLIVEKINCIENEQPKCLQYSLQESFHWLIINDPKEETIVYEITTKFNLKKAIIEASLLNIFSQHSMHDLTKYCSKEADKEVGFVRRLSNEELIEKRRKSKATKFKNIILRSPLELNLIDPLLLEQRSFEELLNWHQLQHMNESTLDAAINEDQLTFVLFWNIENIISKHSFYLWAEASKSLVSRHPTVIFGALACHEFDELCNDYITKPSDYHTIFAFKKNIIFAKTKELRDAKYYIDWIQILMLSPAQEVRSDDELKKIKTGELKSFEGIRPAITIGVFDDRNSDEAKIFMEMAEKLKGRYHFVYLIEKSHPNTVYTIRALEKRKRIDFIGIYEIHELTNFVIRSSLPSVIDISNGFTSDILTHQMQPLVLFVDDGSEEEKSKFAELCAKSSYIICTTIIINSKSKTVDEIIHSLQANDDSNRLIIFLKEKIYALKVKNILESESLLQLIALATIEKPISILSVEDVHPLRYVQVAQINEIFGEQLIEIPSEVQIIHRSYWDKGNKVDDAADYGGCPVMAKARQMMMKDEL
ncbi:Uncharacterized protein ACO02O_06301 [Dirofilaria immitis]